MEFVAILVPLGLGLVLPVMIVWLATRTRINSDNKKTEVLIEAIKSGHAPEADILAEALTKSSKTPRQILESRLLRGCVCTLAGITLAVLTVILTESDEDLSFMMVLGAGILLSVGIGNLIVYFVTRKNVE
ncbi:MAG: hypothetical protein K2L30_12395 [Duncaniella sp.]|nr:hypothetical protein [Duncaniella sp.]